MPQVGLTVLPRLVRMASQPAAQNPLTWAATAPNGLYSMQGQGVACRVHGIEAVLLLLHGTHALAVLCMDAQLHCCNLCMTHVLI